MGKMPMLRHNINVRPSFASNRALYNRKSYIVNRKS